MEQSEFWGSAEINYSLTKRIKLCLEQELRYNNNIRGLNQSLTDLGISYRISSLLRTSLSYRFRLMPGSDEKHRQEIISNIHLKTDIAKLELRHRARAHFRFRQNKETISLLRYRLAIRYPLTNFLKPYLSGELFYRFQYSEGDRLTQGRYRAGVLLGISKAHELDLFLGRELEYNNKKPVNSTIVGFGYCFSF